VQAKVAFVSPPHEVGASKVRTAGAPEDLRKAARLEGHGPRTAALSVGPQ
jgi:hypothetical protein